MHILSRHMLISYTIATTQNQLVDPVSRTSSDGGEPQMYPVLFSKWMRMGLTMALVRLRFTSSVLLLYIACLLLTNAGASIAYSGAAAESNQHILHATDMLTQVDS